MKIGEKLKQLRLENGLTQKALAEKAGVATGTIQQYELGKRQPRIEQLEKLAYILNTTLNDLISDNTSDVSTGSFWHGMDTEKVIAIIDDANDLWKEAGFSPFNPPETDDDRQLLSEVSAKRDLLKAFEKLNISGKQKAVSQIKLLTEIPRFSKKAPTD